MSEPSTLPRNEAERLDRIYREGGLRVMASPHVHYGDEPDCPHPGCGRRMEWIDFKLGPHGNTEGIDDLLVQSWWSGIGFAGRCSKCDGWIRFTTLGMTALVDDDADGTMPRLPDNWADVAQFA